MLTRESRPETKEKELSRHRPLLGNQAGRTAGLLNQTTRLAKGCLLPRLDCYLTTIGREGNGTLLKAGKKAAGNVKDKEAVKLDTDTNGNIINKAKKSKKVKVTRSCYVIGQKLVEFLFPVQMLSTR